MKVKKLEIDGRRYTRDVKVVQLTNVVSEKKPVTGSVFAGVTGGVISKYAWSGSAGI